MNKIGPDHYRYFDEIGPAGLSVVCERYVVLRESEHCYWITKASNALWAAKWVEAGRKSPMIKRVLKESHGRRYAYPDKARALDSYKQRKAWQLRHAQLAMERAKAAIGYFGDLSVASTVPDGELIIPSEYIQGMGWGDY